MLCFLISTLDLCLLVIFLINDVESPILMYKTTPLFLALIFQHQKGVLYAGFYGRLVIQVSVLSS